MWDKTFIAEMRNENIPKEIELSHFDRQYCMRDSVMKNRKSHVTDVPWRTATPTRPDRNKYFLLGRDGRVKANIVVAN